MVEKLQTSKTGIVTWLVGSPAVASKPVLAGADSALQLWGVTRALLVVALAGAGGSVWFSLSP